MLGNHHGDEIEIIEFKIPMHGEKKCLKITNIHWSKCKERLTELLLDLFSQYGLLHSLVVNQSTTTIQTSTYYAFANFYSADAARRAKLQTHLNSLIEGKAISVAFGKGFTKRDRLLMLSKCEDLANHYLGINGWSTENIYHRLEGINHTSEFLTVVKWVSAVRVRFASSNEFVEGVGIGQGEFDPDIPESKGRAFALAQKTSRNAALLNAFSKILMIVLLKSKKVKVEINYSVVEPFYYDPIWERQELEFMNL